MKQTYSLLVLSFCLAEPSLANQPEGWNRVQTLTGGEKLEVLLDGSDTVTGTVEQVSPNSLTLTRDCGSTEIVRWAIQRIWVLGEGSRLKKVGLAALIAFGAGCAIGAASAGYIADMNDSPPGTRAEGCIVVGGIAGGIAGGVAAATPSTRRILVFRAAEGK